MSTKIECDDAISIIGTLPTVEPYPDIYNLLKLEEIINTHQCIIPSTQSSILLLTRMLMQPENYVLSEPNPWQDPANLGAITLIWEIPVTPMHIFIIVTYRKA